MDKFYKSAKQILFLTRNEKPEKHTNPKRRGKRAKSTEENHDIPHHGGE